ncbi:MAG: L-threonine synthase [Thermoprotei archaeon]|nr:MAG: L-threonine synthase [Thermoprotei archaeon]
MSREVNGFCKKCGFKYDFFKNYYYRCPKCGSPLDIRYDRSWNPEGRGLNRYSSMLPISVLKSVGEGSTPIVVREYNGLKLWFKLEYLNPSGSFKDRGSSLALSHAYKLGYKRIMEDSSGNTGLSVSLYSYIYGLSATIVIPKYAPSGKKDLIRLFGASIVEAPTRTDAARIALEMAKNSTIYYVAHTWNPLYPIAYKTIVYEVFEQGFHGDAVVVPIGSGGLALGLYWGFRDLYELGLIDNIPLFIGVQGVSSKPVYERLYGVVNIQGSSELADGILVREPPRLEEIAAIFKETKGCIVLIDNSDIIYGLKKLIGYGFIVEPTSASVIRGIEKAIEFCSLNNLKEVLVPLTGSGLKMLDLLVKLIKL